ncbi:MAG: hypothetical protein AAGC93_08580 [Cyanobacteria bacterium P01_F01_bin.53]
MTSIVKREPPAQAVSVVVTADNPEFGSSDYTDPIPTPWRVFSRGLSSITRYQFYLILGILFATLTAQFPLFRMTLGVATLNFLIRDVVYAIQCYRHPEATLEQRIAFAKGEFWQNILIHSGCLLWGLSHRPAHAAFDAFTALANQLFPDSVLLIDLFVGAILIFMIVTIMLAVVRALLASQRDEPIVHLLAPIWYTALGYAVIETASRALL